MMSKLQAGQLVPNFTLTSVDNQRISRSDYRGKAGLLILFVPPADGGAEQYLRELDATVAGWSRGQRALVIADAAPAGLGHSVVLRDPDQTVRPQFLADAAGGWFITDRYGELYAQGSAEHVGELPKPQELSEWMEFVSMRCGG
jgi:hypothetical protein